MVLVANFIELFVEAAPWLLLGLLVAGMMKSFMPAQLLAKHLSEHKISSVIKAALLGAPLPLCSCGVIPAAVGLRRSGASKAATTSFLISTPETGVDSIAISYALLGPFMAIVRPIAALTTAITAGLLVGGDESNNDQIDSSAAGRNKATDSTASSMSLLTKLKIGLKFSLVDLVGDIVKWLLIGLLMATLIKTWVPNQFLTQWGDGFVAFLVMAIIGVPMYICATASTPIAAGFLFSGLSPGAVLVFMLVGPATNVATIGCVKSELGNRALIAYLSSVILIGFVFGYLTNLGFEYFAIGLTSQLNHNHNSINSVVANLSSIVLALLLVAALYRRYLRR